MSVIEFVQVLHLTRRESDDMASLKCAPETTYEWCIVFFWLIIHLQLDLGLNVCSIAGLYGDSESTLTKMLFLFSSFVLQLTDVLMTFFHLPDSQIRTSSSWKISSAIRIWNEWWNIIQSSPVLRLDQTNYITNVTMGITNALVICFFTIIFCVLEINFVHHLNLCRPPSPTHLFEPTHPPWPQ